jgi:YVTN family beta-propeller protein
MQTTRRLFLLVLAFGFAASASFAVAQVVTSTLPVGQQPVSTAVNSVTNKIYVGNQCGNDPNCQSAGTVTVIDGVTLNTQTVNVGYYPGNVAVNSRTNKIYVANLCGNGPTCESAGTVTVIDGATNDTATVNVGEYYANALAVNPVTNKIYVLGSSSSNGTVTVIDGVTLNTQTVNVGSQPSGIAVNSVTNKIYVMNSGGASGTVTVIDGTTLNTQTVNVGSQPSGIAVNSVTNKIYVVNSCGNDPSTCQSGTVTVIDGVTLNTQIVNAGVDPFGVAVDSTTNRIYVPNDCADLNCVGVGTVTVIDGATDNSTTISGLPVGYFSFEVKNQQPVIDSVSNKVYVRTAYGFIAVIDGISNTIITVGVGDWTFPYLGLPAGPPVAVDETTDKIYVPNGGDGTVSVIAGDTTLQFIPVTPCRVVDTRNPNGPFGGPPILGGTRRDFSIPQGACNIPASAVAYSLNVTVVPSGQLGYLTMWPTSESQPGTSTMNSPDGRVKANAAIMQGGVSAAVSVYASDTTNVILDINGYFAPASSNTLAFFPLLPCRVADTRRVEGPLGGPFLTGGQERDFPVLDATSCGIPDSAQAYSFNFTAVPHGTLGYLTVWPAGQSRPLVSTLNAPTGTIVANAAIVPAGVGGEIAVYPSNDTDMVIDINGYFAAAGSGPNPLSLYPLPACRALDTRYRRGGWFSGELVLDVFESYCGVSNQAQAYVFNATVIPRVWLGYLTLWPDGEPQPQVSTLNAIDGAITSNMAIVVTTNGLIDAYTTNLTQLIVDISGYFAP